MKWFSFWNFLITLILQKKRKKKESKIKYKQNKKKFILKKMPKYSKLTKNNKKWKIIYNK